MPSPPLSVYRPAAFVVLFAAGWLAIGQRCLALGMDWYLAARYWFYAFPSYFSEVYYGGRPYTYFTELGAHFASGNPFVERPRLDALLAAAHNRAVAVSSTVPEFFPADEKGTVDFVRFAFSIFGTHLPSLLYLYLAILAVSLLLFAVRFRREPAALVTGVLALAALYVGVSAFPITREVYSVINPRGVGSLSFIALVHLALLAISKEPIDRRDVPGLLWQSATIVLVIAMRSAENWQVMALTAIAAASRLHAIVRERSPGTARAWLRGLAPVLPVLVMLGGYQMYQRAAYPPEYLSTNVRNKIVWHNVLIGFALHPEIAQPYGLSLNDASVWAFIRYKAAREKIPDYEEVFLDTGLVKGWRRYDELCRQAIFEIAAKHPKQMFELYAWYKPRMLFRTIAYAAGWVTHDLDYYGIVDQASSLLTMVERRAQSAFYNPLAVTPLLLAGAGLLAASREAVRAAFGARTLAAIGAIALFSLVPSFLTYPLVHVVVAAYITFTFALYALAARIGVAILDAAWPDPHDEP